MAIYLEFEGVKGNVTAEGYKDHIAVDSVMFNARRNISMEPGHGLYKAAGSRSHRN